MLSGVFAAKIRKLNPKIKIFCGDNPKTPATLYIVVRNEEGVLEDEQICGIDKNALPEFPIQNKIGRMLKGGWRRAVNMLIRRGLADKQKAEQVFGTEFNVPIPRFVAEADPKLKDLQYIEDKQFSKHGLIDKNGKIVLTRKDLMEMREVMNAKRR